MIYRELGRTGYKVSQLGFGAMRLPMTGEGEDKLIDRDEAIPMIHKAFEAGVNYIDSAVGYCNKDSQRAVGDALQAWSGKREEIVVSTKNHNYGESEAEWWQNLEDSLRRLKVDYIDIYNHHGMGWKRYVEAVKPRISKWMQKAKDQGLIKHICCSSHDDCQGVIKIIDSGYVDVITVQYNILDRKLEPAIAHAKQKNVGVVVMGPVGGGRLGVTSDVLEGLIPGVDRVPELAMRFVLANPNVTVALSGMSTMQHVEENLAVCSDATALSEEHKQAIEEHLERMSKMAELYCTGCGYCTPCPQDVAIPKIFDRYNLGRTYGLWDVARKRYNAIGSNQWDKGNQADACVECGACEPKCPQNIPIIEQLKEAHAALAAGAEAAQ
ncbi:MAG: aldo/keto reductase [Planctomycetota bacterium]